MANTEKLGSQWRGKAWGDGEPIPRVTLPDGTLAEAEAALGYAWNGSSFVKLTVDTGNGGLIVSTAPSANGTSFASITASSSGATTLVAAVSSKKIRVVALSLVANAAVNVKFQSHVAGDISGLYYLAANGGMVLPASQYGWFETTAGEALDINLSGAIPVGGSLVYTTI